jgi:predicted N-acyltransferase
MGDREAHAMTVRVEGGIAAFEPRAWDACTGAGNPFLRHTFFSALEGSGSASPETGWAARHLAIYDGTNTLAAAMPLYLKSHSFGEYVFDHAWANAFEQAGGQYYPKLQAAIPFTPVTGSRLLVRPDLPRDVYATALAKAAIQLCRQQSLSSVHISFPTESEWRELGLQGYLLRQDEQFHWQNRGYGDFDEFLAALSSRKRKTIRRERAAVAESGLSIECLSGDAIEERHWDAFYEFYTDTGSRKWGRPYLNREFFARLGASMADQVLLVLANRDGRTIAGALNLIGADALYGRYWGAVEDHPFLHFECCYYRAIDFAIARQLARVEAGAQGAHKLARGYLPIATYSAHWIENPGFREAVSRYLTAERAHVSAQIEALTAMGPFRRT